MEKLNTDKVKLFTLSSNKDLADQISSTIGLPLAYIDIKKFADGEIAVNTFESVRGQHIFVVQSTSNPVNEHLMELLIFIDAVKRASAKTINIIMPYYGYSRQDRKARGRQPISAKLVANLITVAGADRVISMDLHADQIQGFFDIPIDNFRGQKIIYDYISKKNLSDVVVVSPDHGGTTRARNLASLLDAPIAIVDKRRPEPNMSEVMNVIGNVEGKNCIMIDDMIDTAGSITAGAEALKKLGAKKVYGCCTHPVFSGPAFERLENSVFEEVVCINTINIPKEKMFDKLTVLSAGELLANGIANLVNDKPISPLFEKQ